MPDTHPVYGPEALREMWSNRTMRLATDDDRTRVLALGKELDIPIPGTTTISLDLEEIRALRAGFVRASESDEAIYGKLVWAERRLIERAKSCPD